MEKSISVKRLVKVPKAGDSAARECNWTFNFEGVTDKEVQDLAVDILVIDLQNKYRTARVGTKTKEPLSAKDAAPMLEGEVKVREFLDSKGSRKAAKTKKEKAKTILADLSEEEREAIFKEFKKI